MGLIQLAVLCAMVACSSAITTNQITALKRVISQNVLPGNIALSVRLAFHDCVGPKGCDGCINKDLDSNNGLPDFFDVVKDTYDNVLTDDQRTQLTFADFVALTGVRGVEVSSRDDYTGDSELTFRTGRPTTDSCTSDDGYNENEFPSALDGLEKTISYLMAQFSITEREAVVLLGAHSLGGGDPDNSGFSKPWTENPGDLNNEYYTVLQDAVAQHWEQIQPRANADNHPQWENNSDRKRSQKRLVELLANMLSESQRKKRQTTTPNIMMLNSDMCLYKKLDIGENGISDCAADVATCDDATTKDIVDEMAGDNNKFIDEFYDVFTKMTEKVESGVTLVDATVSASRKDQRKRALVEVLADLIQVMKENEA